MLYTSHLFKKKKKKKKLAYGYRMEILKLTSTLCNGFVGHRDPIRCPGLYQPQTKCISDLCTHKCSNLLHDAAFSHV